MARHEPKFRPIVQHIGEAVRKTSAEQNYLRLNGKYLLETEDLFRGRDFAQVSEKLWGAAAEIVKAVGSKRGLQLGTHASLLEYVSKLDAEHPEWKLRRDFSYAGNLHQNFYEDCCPKIMSERDCK